MQTLLSIVLPTIIIPLILSVIIWKLASRYSLAQVLIPIIWLPSYFLLTGKPVIPAVEAKDWLWVLLSLSFILTLVISAQHKSLNYLQYLLLTVILFAIAWPVLRYQFSVMLVVEILTIAVIATATHYYLKTTKINDETHSESINLILALSCSGLAIVVILVGSLLIGELAATIATVFGVIAVLNFIFKNHQLKLESTNITPLLQLYFAILLLARIYVELSLVLTLLLLLAPLSGLISRQRYGFIVTAGVIISAISWVIISADSSSYY